jgi:hypothetical protein
VAAIPLSSRLRLAARRNVACPACGISLRFGSWPRVVHVIFGDLAIAGGFVASVLLGMPVLFFLALGSWGLLAAALPIETRPQG